MTTFGDPHTSLAVWDAAAFPGPPRAVIHLPQRVPNGLHGNWFAAR
ncbi:MAG: carotenoid oxygenase family protein [Ilumatobacteraceae bacterium]